MLCFVALQLKLDAECNAVQCVLIEFIIYKFFQEKFQMLEKDLDFTFPFLNFTSLMKDKLTFPLMNKGKV